MSLFSSKRLALWAVAGLLLPVTASADWPGWRSADRTAKASETNLLSSWPEAGPPLAWRAAGVGYGYSSLAVVDDRLYTLGDVGEKQFVHARSAADGSPIWKTEIGPGWDDQYIGARSTPTISGEHVYALSTEGRLFCLEASDGSVVWKRDLVGDFGASLMMAKGQYMWKFAESPLVDGDRVIVTPGVAGALMVALDAGTGKEIWRTKVDEKALGEAGAPGTGYSSAVVSEAAGVRQYVQLVGRGAIGVEAKTGKMLWLYGKVANGIANVPTPLVDGDHVFVSTGYGTGAALLHLKKAGDGVKAEEVYFHTGDTMQNHHGGMILDDGHVYFGTAHNKGFPLAVEMKSGKIAWGPIRNDGRGSAAVAYADGHLYFRYQDGLMVLIEATPAEYREKGKFKIPDVDQFSWSHPVITGGHLFLREQDNLFAYDLRAKKAGGEKAGAP